MPGNDFASEIAGKLSAPTQAVDQQSSPTTASPAPDLSALGKAVQGRLDKQVDQRAPVVAPSTAPSEQPPSPSQAPSAPETSKTTEQSVNPSSPNLSSLSSSQPVNNSPHWAGSQDDRNGSWNIDYTKPIDWSKTGQNFGKDVQDQLSGIAALGSVPFLRAGETIGRMSKDYPNSVTNPLGSFIKNVGQPDDAENLKQALSGVVNHYKKDWVEPLTQDITSPQKPEEGGDRNIIGHNFAEHPLSSLIDVSALRGIPFTGRPAEALLDRPGASIINKAMESKVTKNVMRNLPTSGWAGAVAEAMKWTPQAQFTDRVRKILESNDLKRKAFFEEAASRLGKEFDSLPPFLKRSLIGVAEQTDPTAISRYMDIPQVQRFINLSRNYMRQMRMVLGISDAEYIHNTYGPKLLAKLQRENPQYQWTFAHLMQEPYKTMLRDMWKAEDATGEGPVHVALTTASAVKREINNARTKFMGGIEKTGTGRTFGTDPLASAAAAVNEGKPGAWEKMQEMMNQPGWTKSRFASGVSEQHIGKGFDPVTMTQLPQGGRHMNMKEIMLSQIAKTAKYMALTDAIKEIATLKPLPGFVAVDVQRLLQNVANDVGAPMPDLFGTIAKEAKTFEEKEAGRGVLYLPPGMDKMLEEVMSAPEKLPAGLQTLEQINHWVKYARWGLDILFPGRLAMQTAVLQAWQLTRPKDVLGMFAAHILAAHPDIEKAIPTSALKTHMGEEFEPALASSFEKFRRAMDTNLRVTYDINRFQLRASAAYYLLYSAKGANRAVQQVIADIMDSSAALHKVEELSHNPEVMRGLEKHMVGHHGDYSPEAMRKFSVQLKVLGWKLPALPVGPRAINLVFLAGSWMRHAFNIIKTLPMEYPLKMAFLNSFERAAAPIVQGNLPDNAKKMGMIDTHTTGPGGFLEGFKGPEMDSLSGGMSEVMWALNLLLPTGAEGKMPSAMSPIFAIPSEMNSQVDSKNNQKFIDENPAIYEHNGRYYPSGKSYRYSRPIPREELSKYATPYNSIKGGLGRAFTVAFPKQAQPLTTLTNSKDGHFYQPSAFASPWNYAPKNGKWGRPIERSLQDVINQQVGAYSREFPPVKKERK